MSTPAEKNVLILANSIDKKGGADIVISNAVKALKEKHAGLNFVYVVLEGGTGVNQDIEARTLFLENKVPDNVFFLIFYILKTALWLRKFKRSNKIDVSISYYNIVNIINILSAAKDYTIISLHTSLSAKASEIGFKGSLSRFFIGYIYNSAHKIFSPSHGIRGDLIDNFGVKPDKISVIRNMFDTLEISRKSRGMPSVNIDILGFPTLVNVGRLSPEKGQGRLIKILSEVKKTFAEARLIFVGDGDLRHSLKAYASSLGMKVWDITENKDNCAGYDVYFAGFQENPFAIVSKCSCFVLASTREGFANVLAEALLCRVPVVSADCAFGPREILSPDSNYQKTASGAEYAQYGILLPVLEKGFAENDKVLTKTELLWADTLVNLLNSRKTRDQYVQKGPDRARDFDKNNILARWEELLEI